MSEKFGDFFGDTLHGIGYRQIFRYEIFPFPKEL